MENTLPDEKQPQKSAEAFIPREKTTLQQWGILFGATLLLLIIDQITKALVVANLELYEVWVPVPAFSAFFDITYTRNTGAAFGLLQSAGNFFLVVAVVASVIIVYYYREIRGRAYLMRVAMGLQLGGAIGNAIDRITRGFVVDFFHVFYEPIGFDWPIFNIADASIVIGVLLLILLLAIQPDRNPDSAESD